MERASDSATSSPKFIWGRTLDNAIINSSSSFYAPSPDSFTIKFSSHSSCQFQEKAPSAKQVLLEKVSETGRSDSVRQESDQVDNFVEELGHFLDAEDFEPGVKSAAEKYIERVLAEQPLVAQVGVGRVFLSCTNSPRRLIGILTAIAHLDQTAFSPTNELVALSALSHNSVEVKECAIRAYEYWENSELIARLKDFCLTPKWLDDYRAEVVAEYCGG